MNQQIHINKVMTKYCVYTVASQLLLYLLASVPALSCRCMHTLAYLDCCISLVTQYAFAWVQFSVPVQCTYMPICMAIAICSFYACLLFMPMPNMSIMPTYGWYSYLVPAYTQLAYKLSVILTYSCMHCLVYMSIKYVRSILSNRTYAMEFVVSSHARFKIMIQSIEKMFTVVAIL